MPIRAWPRPSRRPVSKFGTEEGKATVRNSWLSVAPKDRATLMKSRSMVRTPVTVLTSMGNTVERKMIATFELRSTPNQMITSGMRAMRGVA